MIGRGQWLSASVGGYARIGSVVSCLYEGTEGPSPAIIRVYGKVARLISMYATSFVYLSDFFDFVIS